MTFADFQRQVKEGQSYFAKMSLKTYIYKIRVYYPGSPDLLQILCTLIPGP